MSRTPIPAPAGSTALSRQSWRRRAACLLAFLAVVLSTVALVATATARSTALNPAYYQGVLDEQKAYDRLVRSGRRLVVFAERADGPAPWYRNFYRYGMETPYAFRSPREMTCAPHRGGRDKRLFLLNHFVTAGGGGSRLDAGEVNRRDRVLGRALACERERGRPVTFIAVDFTTIGDARGAVDALNAIRSAGKPRARHGADGGAFSG